jgi:hypothetical protein
MTVVRQVAAEDVVDIHLRSMWTELDIRDIEEQGAAKPEDDEALESVYDAREILDLEAH